MEPVKDKAGREVRLFSVGDCEWWMGASAAEVLTAANRMYGSERFGDEYDDGDVLELTDEQAATLQFYDDEDRTNGTHRPFIEELRNHCSALEVKAPELFACTEY